MKLAEFARPAIPVGYAQLILDVAATHDVAAADLLAAADVPRQLLGDPNGRLTAWQAGSLLIHAMELSGEPAIGYEIGLHSSLTSHGLMGYGLISASTVREAIALGERFLPLRLPMVSITLSVDGPTGVIDVAVTAPVGTVRQCLVDLFLVGLSRMAPPLTDRRSGPEDMELWFDSAEPDYYARFMERLPVMRFDRGANQARFPASDLDLPLETANRITASMVEEQCRRELEQLGHGSDLVAQVRAALRDPHDGFPDLETVAARLHMSGRTFKRKLHEHGTGFRELVEAVRRAEAIRLLNSTGLSVAQIAGRLGYADASSFSRAFHKWTATTPGAFRARG
jgi:AraC-like DNA-binding protein